MKYFKASNSGFIMFCYIKQGDCFYSPRVEMRLSSTPTELGCDVEPEFSIHNSVPFPEEWYAEVKSLSISIPKYGVNLSVAKGERNKPFYIDRGETLCILYTQDFFDLFKDECKLIKERLLEEWVNG